jgi:hypothetical protein
MQQCEVWAVYQRLAGVEGVTYCFVTHVRKVERWRAAR